MTIQPASLSQDALNQEIVNFVKMTRQDGDRIGDLVVLYLPYGETFSAEALNALKDRDLQRNYVRIFENGINDSEQVIWDWDLERLLKLYNEVLGENVTMVDVARRCGSLQGVKFRSIPTAEVVRALPRLTCLDAGFADSPHRQFMFEKHMTHEEATAITSACSPSVTELHLSGAKIPDLRAVVPMPQLRKLGLSSLRVIPTGILHLLRFPALQSLRLSYDLCQIFRPDVPKTPELRVLSEMLELRKLPELEEIDFWCCKCTVDYTQPMREILDPLTRMRAIGFKMLEGTSLSRPEQTRLLSEALEKFYQLYPNYSVALRAPIPNALGDLEMLEALCQTRGVANVILSHTYFSPHELAGLPPALGKRNLDLRMSTPHTTLTYAEFEEYEQSCSVLFRQDRSLFPLDTTPARYVMRALVRSSHLSLRMLDFSSSKTAPDAAPRAFFQVFPHLHQVNFRNSELITQVGVDCLSTLKELQEVDLTHLPLRSLDPLAHCTNLQRVTTSLGSYGINAPKFRDLSFIFKLAQLHDFYYCTASITPEEQAQVRSRLKQNARLAAFETFGLNTLHADPALLDKVEEAVRELYEKCGRDPRVKKFFKDYFMMLLSKREEHALQRR